MQTKAEKSRLIVNIWTARLIPLVLTGVVGYATYVLVALLCVNYLLVKHDDKRAAIPILVVYFILFFLMATSFFRTLYITTFDPPYLPLGDGALGRNEEAQPERDEDIEMQGHEYRSTTRELGPERDNYIAPGLEEFYTKEVFRIETDGKPRWCSQCCNWKPDRTSHCSDAGRCIYKMDHFCPWVGGPVGETNFKFFFQFTAYTALYCTHLLVVMSFYMAQQIRNEDETYNRHFAAIIGLAGFFGMFTAAMTGTNIPLALRNVTQVENLNSRTMIYNLAVLVPPREELARINPEAASRYTYPIITYPLSTPPPSRSTNVPPGNSSHGHVQLSRPIPLGEQHSSIESTSSRDLKATRTFAILQTQAGDNPWDLGSAFLNWEALMGTSVLDWFLPIRRSPCCNHEDSESYYALGPAVDLLRANMSFIQSDHIRFKRPHPRPKSRENRNQTRLCPRPSNPEELRQVL